MAPAVGREFIVVNWLRSAAIIARKDPVAAGYVTKDERGRLLLPSVSPATGWLLAWRRTMIWDLV
jgi:hypothetical protein